MIRPTIHKCGTENIAELCLITREFIEESYWGFTYDEEVVFNQLLNYIIDDNSDVYITRIDGVIAGGAILIAAQDLCTEKLGYIHKFYIRPQYRKTLAARFLSQKCAEWFDEKNCFVSFSTDTGNIYDTPLICVFQNLMGKCGYVASGATLYRNRGNHGQASKDSSGHRPHR